MRAPKGQSLRNKSINRSNGNNMNWKKKGLSFVPEGNGDWWISHANFPVVDRVSGNVLRIYVGARNALGYTTTTYIEVEADNPGNVLYVQDNSPVIGFGELGCFDDTGAHPAWIVNHAKVKYLYYTGWNAGVSVSYRNSIGLAISDDDGRTFRRVFNGPIVDRTRTEPHFCSTPCVLVEDGLWRMWYLNCVKWEIIDGRSEPLCHLKYAESRDGIHWERDGIVCIDLKRPDEGTITRPCVIREDGIYKMWYSYRGRREYRTNRAQSYRLGYAESDDGIHWQRKDEEVGISVSDEGWDSQMIEYAYVYNHRGRRYMVYNGNEFGGSGLGYAVLE